MMLLVRVVPLLTLLRLRGVIRPLRRGVQARSGRTTSLQQFDGEEEAPHEQSHTRHGADDDAHQHGRREFRGGGGGGVRRLDGSGAGEGWVGDDGRGAEVVEAFGALLDVGGSAPSLLRFKVKLGNE